MCCLPRVSDLATGVKVTSRSKYGDPSVVVSLYVVDPGYPESTVKAGG